MEHRRRNQEKLLLSWISVVEALLRYGVALILEHTVSAVHVHPQHRCEKMCVCMCCPLTWIPIYYIYILFCLYRVFHQNLHKRYEYSPLQEFEVLRVKRGEQSIIQWFNTRIRTVRKSSSFAFEREYGVCYKTPCTYRMFRVKSYKIDGPDGDPLSPLTFHSRLWYMASPLKTGRCVFVPHASSLRDGRPTVMRAPFPP